jgi:AraC-like DNA-binding protein
LLKLVSTSNPIYQFLFEGVFPTDEARNYLVFNRDEPVRAAAESLLREYFRKAPGYQEMVVALLVVLLTNLARTTYTEPERDTGSYLIDDILAFIANNYREVSRAMIARHFNYSERHLSRLLSASVGKTLPDLVNTHRVDAILRRLEISNTPVSRLALEEGFSSVNYFYTVFSRLRGEAFAEYRRRTA